MPNLLAVLHWLLVKTDLFPSFLPKVSFHYDQRSYRRTNCGPQARIPTLPPGHQSASNYGLSSDLTPLCLSYLMSHQCSQFRYSDGQLAPQHLGWWCPSCVPSLECLPPNPSLKTSLPGSLPGFPSLHADLSLALHSPHHLKQRPRVKV